MSFREAILSRVVAGKVRGWKSACVVFLLCTATAIVAPAQTFTTLADFDGADGANPQAGLAQAINGNLYGSTGSGGAYGNYGVIFTISASGTLSTLPGFDNTDGEYPVGDLVQADSGDLYGTTVFGGANGWGTVFKITQPRKVTTLYSFCSQNNCTDGSYLSAGLVQGADGNFYGATAFGGTNGDGTVFKITPEGTLTTLHSFDYADGDAPFTALIQGTDGNFYGTTGAGGAYGSGTVFRIGPNGTLTTLHSFDTTDGLEPDGALVQATDGNFYGTTHEGGANNNGGTVFKITPSGKLTTLYNFCSLTACTDGSEPSGRLIQATDGNFYGTTAQGGLNGYCTASGTAGCGTVFKVTPDGTLTTQHVFDSTDGANSSAGLLQDTSGSFYGTTEGGGASNDGTIFALSVGLGPFVETRPTSGKVGRGVKILGNNLTGSTNVTFNGTAASFTVVSSSEITTSVPTGATTGSVQVTTPSGTLTSNVVFRVRP